MSKPFFDSLQQWIFFGELHDPYSEFFVGLNAKLADKHFTRARAFLGVDDDDRAGGGFGGQIQSHELWAQKYEFREDMRPNFLSEEFGRKVGRIQTQAQRAVGGQIEADLSTLVVSSCRSSRPARVSTSFGTAVRTATGSQRGRNSRTLVEVSLPPPRDPLRPRVND